MSAGAEPHGYADAGRDGRPGLIAGHPHALTNAELRVAAEMIVRAGATPLQARRNLDRPDPRLGHRTPRAVLRTPGGLGEVLAALRGTAGDSPRTTDGVTAPGCAAGPHPRPAATPERPG